MRIKLTTFLNHFFTSLYYRSRILPQLIITAEYNNVIRAIEEAKINLMTWWSINVVDIYIQEMRADFISFLIKHLVRVINKHYGRSVKRILSEPTRRFPHTRVSSMYPLVTYNRGNKTLSTQLYSARLTRQEENKRLQRYASLFDLWVIASAEALLNVHPYIKFY